MKNTILKILFVLTVFLGVSPVLSSEMENVRIDENGAGTWVNEYGVLHTFLGTRVTDPSGGTTANALVYDTSLAKRASDGVTVGFSFETSGDYYLYTTDAKKGDPPAGVVRFYDGHYMIFYDNDQGTVETQSLADRSNLPPAPLEPVSNLYQLLAGGVGNSVVTPGSTMAGFEGVLRTYTFVSILPVPEPGVFSLLACGVALLGLRRKRPVIG